MQEEKRIVKMSYISEEVVSECALEEGMEIRQACLYISLFLCWTRDSLLKSEHDWVYICMTVFLRNVQQA